MKSFKKLIQRFNKARADYEAFLDPWSSYEGFYVVSITDNFSGTTSVYHFSSCNDFAEWMHGVVLD